MKQNITCPECGLELHYNHPADNWFHLGTGSMWCAKRPGERRKKPNIPFDVPFQGENRGLFIKCDRCTKPQVELGALLFSPPNLDGMVRKIHVCVGCYDWLLEHFLEV